MNDEQLDRLVDKLGLDRKVRLLTGATTWRTAAEPDLGLRAMVCSDGPAGVRGESWDERRTSALLPSASALGALWDEELLTELGRLLAAEAIRKGVHVVLAPTLNLHRSPLGGRHFECFSEDPELTGRTGAALIRGIQSQGVAATAKHFVANDSETDRLTVDVRVPDRVLREVYLAPFERAVEAGVWLVMAAYNSVNGTTMTASPLLAEVLKAHWGFDGVVVSDWAAVRTTRETARAALDLAMPGPDSPWATSLTDAVHAGEVTEHAVDDKVRRLLRLAARVGALGPHRPRTVPAGGHRGHRALLRRTVAAASVLLRNHDDVLPLDPAALSTVAVIGAHAATPRTQGAAAPRSTRRERSPRWTPCAAHCAVGPASSTPRAPPSTYRPARSPPTTAPIRARAPRACWYGCWTATAANSTRNDGCPDASPNRPWWRARTPWRSAPCCGRTPPAPGRSASAGSAG